MKNVYRIIEKSENKVVQKMSAYDVGIYLLGRVVKNYIIIKTDLFDKECNERIVALTSTDMNHIFRTLEDH